MSVLRVFLIFTLLFSQLLAIGNQTLEVNSSNMQLLGSEISYFLEEEGLLTVEQALNKFNQGEFERCEGQIFSGPPTTTVKWFAVKVRSNLVEDLWVNVNSSRIRNIQFFKFAKNGSLIDSKNCGSFVRKDNNFNDYFTFWFPLIEKEDSDEYVFVFRIENLGNSEFPFMIGSKDELTKAKNNYDLISIMFLGGMLFIFLYNLIIYIFIREVVYLYYISYVFFITLSITFLNNYPIVKYILGEDITYHYGTLWTTPVLLSILAITFQFLNLKNTINWLYWFFIGLMIFLVIVAISNIFINQVYLTSLSQALTLFVMFLCVCVATCVSIKGNKEAVVFALGLIVLLVGVLIQLLTIKGFIHYNVMSRNAFQVAAFVEVVLFSIALVNKINSLKHKQIELNKSLTVSNEALISTNASLDSFTYHVSHDLKTVLNNTNSLSRMMLKYSRKDNPEKIENIAKRLISVSENGVDTVQTFLSLGMINNVLENEPVLSINIHEMANKVLTTYGLADKIDFTISDKGKGVIEIHEKVLESILLNFITNSIKYSKGKPKAYLKLKYIKSDVLLIYSDNGIGIDMEKNGDKLFKPFVRIANQLNKEGSGVGLYLVQKSIHFYNGSIKLESKLGDGVLITVRMPISLGAKTSQ